MSDIARIGNVVLLGSFRQEQKAPPSLLVERINDNCRWKVDETSKCQMYHFGHRCYRVAEFIVSTVGSKLGWGVCGVCLGEFCKDILERPKAEREKRDAEAVERLQRREAEKAARAAHDAAKLCTGWSKKAPFGLCQQPATYRTDASHGTIERLCGRHVRRYMRWGWKLHEIVEKPRLLA